MGRPGAEPGNLAKKAGPGSGLGNLAEKTGQRVGHTSLAKRTGWRAGHANLAKRTIRKAGHANLAKRTIRKAGHAESCEKHGPESRPCRILRKAQSGKPTMPNLVKKGRPGERPLPVHLPAEPRETGGACGGPPSAAWFRESPSLKTPGAGILNPGK